MRNKNITIPNLMSVARIIMVPFFAYFFLKDKLTVAVVLLVLSGLSDLFDGWIARKFNQITELGKMLDPLADKITQGVVAICLAIKIPEIRLLLILFIVKELLMLCGAIILLKRKKRPTSARWYGKVATTFFYVSVTAIVCMRTIFEVTPFMFQLTSNILLLVTGIFMFYAAVQYFQIFLEIIRSDDEKYKFDLPDEIRAKELKKSKKNRIS
ncbi:CDP-alcohol phosphatidyltransferase family protein [Scatolibacter rhodanostii]|uniref:CDP-alcohol phosphatidyltransferase family protein n=1 Tax=Scatolibacter rhodanostii TaxID=2014781 RepID=UPI000C069C2A|nr:CDP-alcohol phosphatidyltransferase family protein [Scatolibacter rhodanostii]